MPELLVFVTFCGVLGLLAWIVEGPIGRWVKTRRERPESISDAYTTSEKGLF